MASELTAIWPVKTFMPLEDLVVVRQVRDISGEKYHGIEELARNIGIDGLQSNLCVCDWSIKEAIEYLKFVANLPGDSSYNLKSEIRRLKSLAKNGRVVILLAGHRRREAILMIRTNGQELLADVLEFIGLSSEDCYLHRFPEGVPVNMYTGLTPIRALGIQLNENIQREQIELTVQAHAIQTLFSVARQTEPDISIAEWSRRIDLKEHIVRDAIGFRELLPKSIIRSVEGGAISWGCAQELVRVARLLIRRLEEAQQNAAKNGNPMTDDEIARVRQDNEFTLISLSALTVAGGTVKSFRSHISCWEKNSVSYDSMFDDFQLTSPQIVQNVLGNEAQIDAVNYANFLQRAARALSNGWLDKAGRLVPLHRKEARKSMQVMLSVQSELNKLLKGLMPKEELKRLNSLTTGNIELLAKLERYACLLEQNHEPPES